MNRWMIMLMLWCLAFAAHAQHPHYQDLLQKGDAAMAAENWQMADRYLEIAAFGFLDHAELLASTYMRLAIVGQALEDQSREQKYLNKAKHAWPGKEKPEFISQDLWLKYQVLAGLRKPPPPPIPKSPAALQEYVKDYPQRIEAWSALLDHQMSNSGASVIRGTLSDALKAHPRDVSLRETALRFAVEKDRGRNAEKAAENLLVLDPTSSLANEVLGNLAVRDKDYQKANAFYEKMKKASLDDTADLMRKMDSALAREKRAAEKAQDEKERQLKAEAERLEKAKEKEEELRLAAEAEKKRQQADDARKSAEADKQKRAEEEARKARERASRDRKTAQVDKPKPKVPSRDEKKEPDEPKPKSKAELQRERIAELEALIDKEPKDIEAKYELLDLQFERNNTREAKKVLADLGKTEVNSERYAGAFARYNYLKRAYRKNVRDLADNGSLGDEARYYLGKSYFSLRKYDKAREILRPLDRQKFPDLRGIDGTIDSRIGPEKDDSETRQSSRQPEPEEREKKEADDSPGEDRFEAAFRNANRRQQIEMVLERLEKDDINSVRRTIRRLYNEEPKNQQVVYMRARLYLAEGDLRRASTLFYNLASSGYHEGEVLYYGGLAAYRNGDKSLADYMLRRAKSRKSKFVPEINSILLQEVISSDSVQSKKIQQKIEELEELTRKYQFAEPRISLLRLYMVTHNDAGFERVKNELTGKSMSSESSDLLLAWNLCRFKHYERVLEVLQKRDGEEATFAKGYVYHMIGNNNLARRQFRKLEGNDKFPEVPLFSRQ